MFSLNTNFNPSQFLHRYWQKEPVVLRQLIPGFIDPLDEHDLAGLAMEEEVDSRIVSAHKDKWQVSHGPFSDFEDACKGSWTLLVQGVDKYIDDTAPLMEAFRFIPYWRMDDLMVSFAVNLGGVGPHTDQYDVFLVQGKGRRHWRVGKPGNHPSRFPHPELSQIAPFPPEFEVTLEPGDVLYIPPGWPHDGKALEDCMTYSVGFRAPDQALLMQYAAESFSQPQSDSIRYSDANLSPSSHPGEVTHAELSSLRSLVIQALMNSQWDSTLLRMLSDQGLPANAPDALITADELINRLEQGEIIRRTAGCRPIYAADQKGDLFSFYINGEAFSVDSSLRHTFVPILEGEPVTQKTADTPQKRLNFIQSVLILVNKGYWEWVPSDSR